MRLTTWLLRNPYNYKPKDLIPHRFRGKHRTVKPPNMSRLKSLRNDLDQEEENMLYLRHPYLTIEESAGHVDAYEKEQEQRNPELNYSFRLERIKRNFQKTVTLPYRMVWLRRTERWE